MADKRPSTIGLSQTKLFGNIEPEKSQTRKESEGSQKRASRKAEISEFLAADLA